MRTEADFAPNFVALHPFSLRRTARYACVRHGSERLVIHQNPPRPTGWCTMKGGTDEDTVC